MEKQAARKAGAKGSGAAVWTGEARLLSGRNEAVVRPRRCEGADIGCSYIGGKGGWFEPDAHASGTLVNGHVPGTPAMKV